MRTQNVKTLTRNFTRCLKYWIYYALCNGLGCLHSYAYSRLAQRTVFLHAHTRARLESARYYRFLRALHFICAQLSMESECSLLVTLCVFQVLKLAESSETEINSNFLRLAAYHIIIIMHYQCDFMHSFSILTKIIGSWLKSGQIHCYKTIVE